MFQKSTEDDILLSQEVELRIRELEQAFLDKVGVSLQVPKDLQADYHRFIQMRLRHRTGDFRHDADEKRSLQQIAQWTVNVNCVLRGQQKKAVQWKD